MKCPNCNREIPNEAKFCLYCGTKIEVDSTIECPKCHHQIPADSKFCPDCGVRIEPLKSNEDPMFQIGNVQFKMIHVEGGTFMMGANPEWEYPDYDETPTHQVTLSSFYIGETPVTQALWQAVMGSNPSWYEDDQNPVEHVSWNDCQDFIKELNQKTGKKFRLLSEAEWEFAARGGTTSKGYLYSGSDSFDEVAWCGIASGPQIVKQKKPNEIGLYDMSGNVWEWCQDWYGDYSKGSQTNPTGPTRGSSRVCRGGCWYHQACDCRISSRWYNLPDASSDFLGLRLALSELRTSE